MRAFPRALPGASAVAVVLLTSLGSISPASAQSSGQRPSSGFEIVAIGGINDMGGDADNDYGTGGHLELLLGGRLGKTFSLDAGLSLDILNFNDADQFDSYASVLIGFTLAPTFHFGSRDTEFVVGPRIGLFVDSVSAERDGAEIHGLASGLVWGLSAGVLFRVGSGDTRIGPLLGWQSHEYDQFCQTTNGDRVCVDVPSDYEQSLVSVSLAAWF